jgi:hypothetical protein
MFMGLHVKCRYSCRISMELYFFDTVSKNTYQISLISVQWEPKCPIRTERRTDVLTDQHDENGSRFTGILLARLKFRMRSRIVIAMRSLSYLEHVAVTFLQNIGTSYETTRRPF